jgi:hypothetical protein
VGGSLLVSGLALLLLAFASTWGSASNTWQLVHWLGGLFLTGAGIIVSTVALVHLADRPQR